MKSFPIVNLAKEDWANPRRARKQLLFEALIKQSEVEEVLYFDPPRHFWHSRPKANSSKKGIKVLQRRYFIPGERFAYVRAVNRAILYFKIKKYLKSRAKWYTFFYHPIDALLSQFMLRHGPVFYDWTEDWATYHNDPLLSTYQNLAIKRATGVIVVAKSLESRVRELVKDDKQVLFLPNATSWVPGKSQAVFDDLANIDIPRIGYFGQIGPWFDKDLVIELARARPQWHWVLIGHVQPAFRKELNSSPNIHLLGQKPYHELPAYAEQCQILAAPYRNNFSGDGTKLYDYLTIGHPIISSGIETAERLQPFVHIANNFESWLNALAEVLNENGTYLREARQKESLNHTWDIRANVLLSWLSRFHDAK